MGNLWSSAPPPEDQLKQSRKTLRKSIRGLDRERARLQQDDHKLQAEIRKLAQNGQLKATLNVAKNLVRVRHSINTLYDTRTKLEGLRMQLRQMDSIATMEKAMREATVAMMRMNRRVNVKELASIMKEYERQAEFLNLKQEMMDDVIDGTKDEDEDEEANQVLHQILDEIGVQVGEALGSAPAWAVQTKEDEERLRRLEELKKE